MQSSYVKYVESEASVVSSEHGSFAAEPTLIAKPRPFPKRLRDALDWSDEQYTDIQVCHSTLVLESYSPCCQKTLRGLAEEQLKPGVVFSRQNFDDIRVVCEEVSHPRRTF